jgi:predicted enzyme related to lactoylglutathione lyase
MSHPVVHFEIVGGGPATLRDYYAGLFGWEFQVGDAVTEEVSRPGEYGFVGNAGINGGVCGGAGFAPRVLFYIGVTDVEAALCKAEELGGKRVMGPARAGGFAVGHFTDPEGNLVGVAGQEESR